jgi:hypothetical protein
MKMPKSGTFEINPTLRGDMRTPTEEELRATPPALITFGHGTTAWPQDRRPTARGWRRHNDGTRTRTYTRWYWVAEDGAITSRGVAVVHGDPGYPTP